ncbi:MAG: tRNA guanosine(15) transglycosylase TgtA [Methanotrichaceae archaeon]
MPDCFEILDKDLAGRIGRLRTPHGVIETPVLMPVVNPHLRLIEPADLKKMGAEILITNSYIINQDDILRNEALKEGVHDLLGFDGPIMTDSGAFQLSVYGDIEVQPLEILQFQKNIKSDICVPLDIPTRPDVSRNQAESELHETEKRLIEAREYWDDYESLLAAPIQGSIYLDLRESTAKMLRKNEFGIYPIGAVVPLMEDYRFRDLVNVVAASKKGLGPGAPVHLFGAGHPMMFALAAALGCDLFDSAAYALYARQGRYLTPRGTSHLENLRYLPCCCEVCQNYTPKELMNDEDRVKLLAMHNLYVSFQEMRLVKQCIWEGSLWELLESRCRSHPRMLEGLRALCDHRSWLEEQDLVSKSTFFYLGPESAARPEVIRYRSRMKRIELSGDVLVTDPGKEIEGFDQILWFKPPFGPYPPELGETYPLNAEVPEEADSAAMEQALINLNELIEANPDARFALKIKSVPDAGSLLEGKS